MKKYIFIFALLALAASAGVTYGDNDKSPPGKEFVIASDGVSVNSEIVNAVQVAELNSVELVSVNEITSVAEAGDFSTAYDKPSMHEKWNWRSKVRSLVRRESPIYASDNNLRAGIAKGLLTLRPYRC